MTDRQPEPEEVRQLPALTRFTIPPEWEDHNGHVNIQFYMSLYERAGWPMVRSLGMDESYFKERRRGLFDLEHHVRYLSEIHVGETVSVHARLIDRSAKRFHGVMFVVNDSRDRLASTLEFITSGADLERRRSAPYPDDIAAAIERVISEHRKLTWEPPVCGIMSA